MQTSRIEIAAYLLPAGLLILALWSLTDFVRRRHQEIGATLFARRKLIISIALVVAFFLFDVPFLLSRHVEDLNASSWKYWLQTAAGNWSPPDDEMAKNLGKYLHAFSITIAILLNNTLYLVIITLVWRIGTKWREAMKVAAAVRLERSFTRTAIEDILEDRNIPENARHDLLSIYDAAVKQAQFELQKTLPEIDKDEALKILTTIGMQTATPAKRAAVREPG